MSASIKEKNYKEKKFQDYEQASESQANARQKSGLKFETKIRVISEKKIPLSTKHLAWTWRGGHSFGRLVQEYTIRPFSVRSTNSFIFRPSSQLHFRSSYGR